MPKKKEKLGILFYFFYERKQFCFLLLCLYFLTDFGFVVCLFCVYGYYLVMIVADMLFYKTAI